MQSQLSYSLDVLRKSPCLIVTDAHDQQSLYELREGKSLLAGSAETCTIRLPGDEANLLHCLFQLKEGTLWVQDWNTQGKTLVNGSPVENATSVSGYDELIIGTHRISACLSGTSAASAKEDQPEQPLADPTDALPAEELDCPQTDQDSAERCDETPEPCDEPVNEWPIDQWPVDEWPVDQWTVDECPEDPFSCCEGDSFPQMSTGIGTPIGQSDSSAAFVTDELETLRNEVTHLQIELAEKDTQLMQLCEASRFSDQSDSDVVSASETERLVDRLEQLLAELEGADDKVAALENQVHAAEHANQAEQEERHQLESWVDQIEQRLLAREAEAAAESEKLQKCLQEERLQRSQVESQLKNALQLSSNGNSSDQAAKNMIDALREQNVELEARLNETLGNLESQVENASRSVDGADPEELRELQHRVRTLESELAGERAESARKTEQLARFQHDMEKRLSEVKQTAENASRVDAMKQHLRELHQEEKLEQQERFERSLGGRITRLWQKIDGR